MNYANPVPVILNERTKETCLAKQKLKWIQCEGDEAQQYSRIQAEEQQKQVEVTQT